MMSKLKNIVRPLYTTITNTRKEKRFSSLVTEYKQKGLPLKVVIGSADIYDKNWLPSEQHILDLLDESTWDKYFEKNEIEAMLAEHVWEHLTPEQGIIAAKVCYKYLKKGGYLRVAVPDGFHKDPSYIDYVKPGGHGAGADDHKLLYTYQSFSETFRQAGFQIELLEYFDENRVFQTNDWDIAKGKIHRSIQYDDRNKDNQPNYTSIIIDAIKI